MTRFSVRIFLGYFLILALAAILMLQTHVDTVQPAMRQSVEDALADTAYLMAAALSNRVANHGTSADGALTTGAIQPWLDEYLQYPQQANIWGVHKQVAGLRVYITDALGLVVADTRTGTVGADYAQWNDVYLTLRGQYGARATQESGDDDAASTLYVASPIRNEMGECIGVVSVGRNVQALQPYVDGIRANIYRNAGLMLGIALVLAALFSAWISVSVRQVAHYAQAVSQGQRDVQPPQSGPQEIRMLGKAVDAMRQHLEGKAYVEHYVHALAHALKSPLAGIQAHLELLEGPLDDNDRQRLLGFAQQEAHRMRDSIERLQQLARLEQQQSLQHRQSLDLASIMAAVVDAARAHLDVRAIHCTLDTLRAREGAVEGEPALVHLALESLLANALAFTPSGGYIHLSAHRSGDVMQIELFNSGSPIPDYALQRVFERFYSLPRPDTGQRSSGLGLSLAREIALLHGGDLRLDNRADGVVATLSIKVS